MASGKWTIRLVGTAIPQPQTVYYAAYAGGGERFSGNSRYSR